MSQLKRSRMRLLQLQKNLEFISHGIKIMTDKRDSLMKEFHGLVQNAYDARKTFNEDLKTAARSLSIARGVEPHRSLLTSALAAQRKLNFLVSSQNIWGIRIPIIDFPDIRRGHFERGAAPGYRNPVVDETALKFEIAINSLAKSAATENKLTVIGRAIRATSRKINALEEIIAPEIKAEISGIRNYFEEIAREDIFRIKRYKKLKTKNR